MPRGPFRGLRFWPYLVLAVLLGIAYLPLFSGQVLYQRDVGRQLFPERSFLHDSYRAGDSPLWNPLIGLGISTLANPLNQVFYPPNALLLVAHSPRVTSFFLFFHLVLGGLGMMALIRRLAKVPIPAALVSGLAWCLSGYTTSEVIAGMRLMSGAYLPWTALAFLHYSRLVHGGAAVGQRLAGLAWAALPLGLCFATGEVFFPILAAAFAICVVAADLWANAAEPPIRRRAAIQTAAGLGLAVGLAVALAAVVVFPALRAAQGTDRSAALSREAAEIGSLHPWRVAEMVAHGAMGDPYTDYPAGPWVGEPGLGDRPLLYGVYLGCTVLALAVLAFGRRQRLAAVLGVTSVFFLLVSFGRYLGLHSLLRLVVPPLAYMRGPEKYLAIVTAGISLLAGLGCARLLDDGRRLWMRALSLPLALGGLALAAGWFAPPMVEPVRTAAVSSLPFVLAAVALAWLVARRARLAGALCVGLVVVDLARSVFALQNFVPPEQLGATPEAAHAILADAQTRGDLAPPRAYRPSAVDPAIAAAAPPTSVAQVQKNLVNTLIDNHAGSFGIACVPGYDAALPSTLSSLWQAGMGAGLDLLRLTGTEYVILPKDTPPSSDLQPLLDPAGGVRLFRVGGVLPRVYLSRARSQLPDSSAAKAVFTPEIIAGDRVVLAPSPEVPAHALVDAPATEPPGICRLKSFSHARIEADCDARSPALAVFVEQYDRGWSATVDGRASPILRANLAMRAVPMGGGRHHVILTFAPPGLRFGVALSLAAVVVLTALLLFGRLWPLRPRPRRQ
jgi:hypothetical protein